MTHEQIMASLPAGAFDKASVWRILSDLAEHRILRRMDQVTEFGAMSLLMLAAPSRTTIHIFYVRPAVTSVASPALEVRAINGTIPDILLNANFHVRVTGTCGACVDA